MNGFPKIDLHMHTTVSDGTDTPEEILSRVRAAGLSLFSVTDHDAFKASGIVPPLLRAGDPGFLSGAEFSCRDDAGKYHILGYGFDPEAPSMVALSETGHRNRMAKVQARLEQLETVFGFSFSDDERRALFAMDNPGKPHIANLMVRHGYAATKEDAFGQYLNTLHVPALYLRPETAITAIAAGGGVPVLAHPAYGDGDQLILGDALDARLNKLVGMGLRGVEAYYSGFPPKITAFVLSLAERYGLYVTAGSDYHGKNKMVTLGDIGAADAAPPAGMTRFLEAVSGAIRRAE